MKEMNSFRDAFAFMMSKGIANSKKIINGEQGNIFKDFVNNLAEVCTDKNIMDKKVAEMHKIYQKTKGEVYTPHKYIQKMLDAIETYYPTYFEKKIKFYDGCCGVANAHVVLKEHLRKRLSHLYESDDDFQRDIISSCLFGNDIQHKNVLMGQRNVDPKGLVENNENFTCEDFKNLIGKFNDNEFPFSYTNPPYAISSTEDKMSSRPRVDYGAFLKEMIRITSDICIFIHPIKSLANRSNTPRTNKAVRDIIMSGHIREIHFYDDITTKNSVFENTDIRGGVCLYLYDKHYIGATKVRSYYNDFEFEEEMVKDLRECVDYPGFIYSATADSIIKKVRASEDFIPLSSIVSGTKPFGIRNSYKGFSDTPTSKQNVLYYKKKKPNIAYVSTEEIKNNMDAVYKWKCFVPKTNRASNTFPHQFYSRTDGLDVAIGVPNSCCSEGYFMVDGMEKYLYDENTCQNFVKYCNTKFHQFLAYVSTLTQDSWTNTYYHIPILDFTREWTDEDLKEKYNLSDEEMDFIDKMIVL